MQALFKLSKRLAISCWGACSSSSAYPSWYKFLSKLPQF